ncbi:hypothetical protein Goklo_013012 [Gossypium klotzschianum]|uniref:Peptidase S8/S53 domain-containing protein n=1 Tax=Gossypium klotzschianum TaxID=34286 RepID=A0A7J8U3J4_9ROSI|nr:hypothetical protein [Gossypium klotzschianum]
MPRRAVSLSVSLIPESSPSRTASTTKASVHHPKVEGSFKLIRARVYTTDSARDTEGHGSHTASTAARNNIVNASFSGLAEGTARGGFHQQGLLHINVPVAIGAFHAAENGILVVQSAGNSGTLGKQTVSIVAPWILTVAARTIDRLFIDKVVLGDGTTLTIRTEPILTLELE